MENPYEIPLVAQRAPALSARNCDGLVEKHRNRLLEKARAGCLDGISERRLTEEKELLKLTQSVISGKKNILIMVDGVDCTGKSGSIRRFLPAFDHVEHGVHHFKAPEEPEDKDAWLAKYTSRVPTLAPGGQVILWDRSYLSGLAYDMYFGVINMEEGKERAQQITDFEAKLLDDGWFIFKYYLYADADRLAKTLAKREILSPARLSICDYTSYRDREAIISNFNEYMLWTNRPVPWQFITMSNRFEGRKKMLEHLKETLK